MEKFTSFQCFSTKSTIQATQPMEEMHIRYDEWLYRFAVGILFRGLVNEAINSFMNSEEIYSTFAMCRKLLLNQGSLQTVHKPVVHLVSPVKPETNARFIGHVHNAPFLFALTNQDLKTGLKEIPRVAHFFLARIGNLNLLLLFECADKTIMPQKSVLHASQSSFQSSTRSRAHYSSRNSPDLGGPCCNHTEELS